MIDIIIPAYNAHETLPRCLGSIAMQTKVKECCVTVVDDCSSTGYEELLEPWKKVLDLHLIRLEENAGPGRARQAGYYATGGEYVTFIDADDTFATAFALEYLMSAMRKGTYGAVCGTFAEETSDGTFVNHENDLTWMFGKLYKRAFLDKYKVRFIEEDKPSRANEDNGFNTIVRLVATEDEDVGFIREVVYFWHCSPSSITRMNDNAYTWDQSFIGYAANMAYAVNHVRSIRPDADNVNAWAVQCLTYLYLYFSQLQVKAPVFEKQAWDACKRYFNEAIAPAEDKITEQMIRAEFGKVQAANLKKMGPIAPAMTLWQFLAALKEGC